MGDCNLCGNDGLDSLLELGAHPIAHRFLSDPKEAEYTHPVKLAFCPACGLIQLVDPIPPQELYTHYNWLSSWKWNPHVPRLLELVETAGLARGARIVEAGCNDGAFLVELKKKGFTDLAGIEPTDDAGGAARMKGLDVVQAYFGRRTAEEFVARRGPVDLFITRQVLEHIPDLADFREGVKTILRPGGWALIEVPDFDLCLDTPDYSAIWEEHVNYFTKPTLARFFADCGLRTLASETAVFSGRALFALGRRVDAPPPAPPANGLGEKARRFRDAWPRFRRDLLAFVEAHRAAGGRAAVYGGGCRACGLINFSGLGPYLDFCVDDQPEKIGKYLPGSRLKILPGAELAKTPVTLCLLAVNAENEEAVIGKHAAFLERGGKFVSVHPPSARLPGFWGAAVR